ncbi:GTP-binding protein [Streptomyces sp. NPDC001407]|uniref:GTP-binding protein n=1 Tax=unclassified Streptomyces TaxID=2593676 RepID=UPI0034052247
MPKQAYVRTKPHLNIATMGHTGHGKTTLTAAITRLLGTRPAPGTAPVPHVAYETGTRHYAHADLPGGDGRVKHTIAATAGLDGAILVVSALDGIGPRTAEHLLLARQSGVRHLVVALSKADAGGPELTELVELETRALLTAHGYDGAHTPVVRVSALRALDGDPRWTGTIEALLDAVDTYVPTPERRTGGPLLLPVERVFTLTGRGTAVAGTVERGTVRPGAAVDIVGRPAGPRRTEVTGLETFGEPMAGARAGDGVALLLRGVERHEVHRGDVVAAPGSVLTGRRFRARVRLLPAAEGGRSRPLATGCRAQFHFRTADVPGTVDLGPHGPALPGRPLTLTVTLDRAAPLERGLPLMLREAGRTIGVGEVV